MKMIQKNTKIIIIKLMKDLSPKNVNQISRELKISVGSAFKILKELEKNSIVSAEKIGNAKYYNLDLKNTETIKLCELLLLEEGREIKGYTKIYAGEIKNFKNAELIIMFGSILRGDKFNDVDVLFVTNKAREVTNFCLEISKTKSRPVIPLILKKQDLIKEIKNKKEPILNIIKTGVVLKGESVFLDVIKNAKS